MAHVRIASDQHADTLAPVSANPALRSVLPRDLSSVPVLGLAESLELGEVLTFAPGMLPLPPEPDLRFLRDELGRRVRLANVGYHPEGNYVSGLKGDRTARERAKSILRVHNREITRVLGRALPEYARSWQRGLVSFRPLQEKGRKLPRRSSNELVHVDAFASGATHGRRLLRLYTNIHPTEMRVWKSAGLFPELWREFGRRAGVAELGTSGLAEKPLDRIRTGSLRFISKLGLPQAMTVDSSPYDRAMKALHDTLKEDDAFQAQASRWVHMEFPPSSSWLALTDMVSHAVVSGQHALVNTWTVDLASCRRPDLAPYHVLGAKT